MSEKMTAETLQARMNEITDAFVEQVKAMQQKLSDDLVAVVEQAENDGVPETLIGPIAALAAAEQSVRHLLARAGLVRQGGDPVALAHISLEDDGPYIDLEVLNGENLQPSDTPVPLYALVNAYRTGNLVQIDREGMRERVANAICNTDTVPPDDPDEYWVFLADAAIAAILGGE